MSRVLAVLTLLATSLLLQACGGCGSIVIRNTLAESGLYNGSWFERCGGLMGSTGIWDMFADNQATLTFSADAAGDRSWDGIDVEISVGFSNTLLVPGDTIALEQMGGGAALNPCIDCRQDQAGLSEGTIEVLSGWQGEDPCAEEDGPEFRLHWDLLFGDGTGPTYEVSGTDQVVFSTFVSDLCGG